jgi:serine/threonine protein kinase
LRGVIGAGEFGVTYKAIQKATLDIVAIKEHLPGELVQRHPDGSLEVKPGQAAEFAISLTHFQREAETLRQIHHPSVVHCRETFFENGTAYLVLEYLEGETLKARLLQGRRLTGAETLRLLAQLLSALETVHAAGVLHRDIKPANIVLTAGRAYLVDFGATMRQHQSATTRLLTPAYAPLEQFSASAELVPQTDLFALAATAIEALTGTPPRPVLERANGSRLEALFHPELQTQVLRVLESALSLRIDERPSSAADMRSKLGLVKDERVWGPDSRAV